MYRRHYTVQRYRGALAVVFYDAARKRHRYTLGTADETQAELLAPAVYAEATRPRGTTIGELWAAYDRDKAGRAILAARQTTWKALSARFAGIAAEDITTEDVEAHIQVRRAQGRKDGTIYTELSHLRTTLIWAVKMGLLPRAPHIRRPSQPAPREAHITKEQARALIAAADLPHVKLFIALAIGTGARNAALLGLTWDRVDFQRERINLQDPTIARRHKGRAVVPMNKTVKAALLAAKPSASCPYVIEWRGQQCKSLKKSVKSAARRAGLLDVSPHVFRHSAAVFMAEDGVPMEEIAQFLGHTDIRVTRRIYARYSPEYLRKAAGALEL
jgi:integrase